MKSTEFTDKIKGFFSKAGKKAVITACTVFVLGCAVVLNVILYQDPADKTDPGNNFAIDLSQSGNPEEGEPKAESTAVTDYFSTMTISRQQARDEAMEVLLAVAESATALEEAKTAAVGDINKLAAEIETESNIETLILSKGFPQCIAVLNGDSCNIIVESSGLLPTEVAQISEIVYEQSGVLPTNLKIIEKNAVNIET